jgi:hypothetical protein
MVGRLPEWNGLSPHAGAASFSAVWRCRYPVKSPLLPSIANEKPAPREPDHAEGVKHLGGPLNDGVG